MSSFDELCKFVAMKANGIYLSCHMNNPARTSLRRAKKQQLRFERLDTRNIQVNNFCGLALKNQNFSRMENKARTLRFLD